MIISFPSKQNPSLFLSRHTRNFFTTTFTAKKKRDLIFNVILEHFSESPHNFHDYILNGSTLYPRAMEAPCAQPSPSLIQLRFGQLFTFSESLPCSLQESSTFLM